MTGKSGEFERIARIFAPLAEGFPGAFGLTDDAALVTPGAGRELVVTTDTMVAGIHFIGDEDSGEIAAKLLCVNLSDLAAMGAAPLAYMLNIALPGDIDDAWLERFSAGLERIQSSFAVALAGGDSVATPGALTLTITAFGEVASGQALRRSGAEAGDIVYVSGTIGDAALGLKALRGELTGLSSEHSNELIGRYRLPRPRVELGTRLAGSASAAIDVSDGLAADLGHILEASGVGAEIDAAAVPLSEPAAAALRNDAGLMEVILTGGDDYELLFTVAAGGESRVAALSSELSLPLTAIGRIISGGGLTVVAGNGEPMILARRGWEHV
jgi:thiamine-monophosphate kinase